MKKENFYVVGIGASAGGIEALLDFFKNVSHNPGVAFVAIRHLKRDFKSIFGQLLKKHTSLPVITVNGGEKLEPNKIFLLRENTKVYLKRRTLFVTERPEDEIVNYAINEFFVSLAAEVKDKAIGIILSGAGSDGLHGVKAIEAENGLVLVQDPSTAEFDSMPKTTIYFDHPDYILTTREMARFIEEYTQDPKKTVLKYAGKKKSQHNPGPLVFNRKVKKRTG